MATKKLPAFQLYPGDWRKDPGVQALNFEYRGVWFELLLLMHESEQRGKLLLNGNAMPDEAIARLLGLDKQKFSKIKSTLLDYGVASICEDTGALMNRRMVRDEEIRKKRREAGKKGGNPDLVKQKRSKKEKRLNQNSNQNTTPSFSTSSSSSNKPHLGGGENAREGPAKIEPPETVEKVIEIGNMKGVPPEKCEVYFDLRSTDNFHRQDKHGNWKPILNWHADLSHLNRKGALDPKNDGNTRKTKGDRRIEHLRRYQ